MNWCRCWNFKLRTKAFVTHRQQNSPPCPGVFFLLTEQTAFSGAASAFQHAEEQAAVSAAHSEEIQRPLWVISPNGWSPGAAPTGAGKRPGSHFSSTESLP